MAEWTIAVVLKTNEGKNFRGFKSLSLHIILFAYMYLLFINFEESFFILLIALIIFGPKKIPEVARSMGYIVKYFKNFTKHFRKEIGEVCHQIGDLKDITSEIDHSIKGTIHRID